MLYCIWYTEIRCNEMPFLTSLFVTVFGMRNIISRKNWKPFTEEKLFKKIFDYYTLNRLHILH